MQRQNYKRSRFDKQVSRIQKYNIPTRNAGRNIASQIASAGRNLEQAAGSPIEETEGVRGYRKVKYYTEDVAGIASAIMEKGTRRQVAKSNEVFMNKIMAADPRRIGKDLSTERLTKQDYDAFKRLSRGGDWTYDRTKNQKANSFDTLGGKHAQELRKYSNFHRIEDDLRERLKTNPNVFTERESKLLSRDNAIFQIYSGKDLRQLENLLIKDLKLSGMGTYRINGREIANVDWNRLKKSDIRNILKDRSLNMKDRAVLSALAEVKGQTEKLSHLNKKVRRPVKNLLIKLSGTDKLRETDIGEGYSYSMKFARAGFKTLHVARTGTSFVYGGTKFAGRLTAKAVDKVGLHGVASGMKKVGHVLTAPERGVKYVRSIPGRMGNAAGRQVGKAGRAAGRTVLRSPVGKPLKFFGKIGRGINQRFVQPFKVGFNTLTKPFRMVGAGASKVSSVIGSILKKVFFVAAIVFFLLFMVVMIGVMMSTTSTTTSSFSTVILDTKEHFKQYEEKYNQMEAAYTGQLDVITAAGPQTLNSKGEKIPTFGNGDFKLNEEEGGNTRNGIIVKYLDKNGNQSAVSTNIEDILSMMAVMMSQTMATDDYHYQAAQDFIEACYKSSHLYYTKESPLYPCKTGCEDVFYYCNDKEASDVIYNILPGVELKMPIQGTLDYSDTFGCKGRRHYHTETDDEGNSHRVYDGTERYCDGHIIKCCFGHIDLEMDYIVLNMEDLMSNDLDATVASILQRFPNAKTYDGTEYHNYIADWQTKYADIASYFLETNWSKKTIEWAKSLRQVDFIEYGITPSFVMESQLTETEIEAIRKNLEDIDEVRQNLVITAYEGVGVIPYHWDWRNYDSLHPGIEANRFGSTVQADYKGRNKKGLDCSGFVDWVYLTNGIPTFGAAATGGIWPKCNQISRSELKPGDLGFKNIPAQSKGINHVGIFAGLTDSGQEIWIHCAGSTGCIKSVGYGGFKYYCTFPALN